MCVFAIIVIGPAVKFPYSLMYENTSSNVLFITEPDSLCVHFPPCSMPLILFKDNRENSSVMSF